jgi:hypothetical protein
MNRCDNFIFLLIFLICVWVFKSCAQVYVPKQVLLALETIYSFFMHKAEVLLTYSLKLSFHA